MSNYYSDPTASAAIGAVDKELNQMKKRAKQLAKLRRTGSLTWEEELRARRQFTGIYSRLLKEAFAESAAK